MFVTEMSYACVRVLVRVRVKKWGYTWVGGGSIETAWVGRVGFCSTSVTCRAGGCVRSCALVIGE